MNRMILFETTHHAMWAEEIAREEGVGAEVVPAPEGSDAKCGLALEIMSGDLDRLVAALVRSDVPHRVS